MNGSVTRGEIRIKKWNLALIFTCEEDMMMVMCRSRHGFEWQQTVDAKQHFAIRRLPFQM